MRNRRAFPFLLLLAWPALTGCGAVAGGEREPVGTPSASLRDDGVRSLRPGEGGSVTVGTSFGLLPLPLLLAVAAGALAMVAAGLYLWHRNRRTAPTETPAPGTWRAGPVPPGMPPFPAGEAAMPPFPVGETRTSPLPEGEAAMPPFPSAAPGAPPFPQDEAGAPPFPQGAPGTAPFPAGGAGAEPVRPDAGRTDPGAPDNPDAPTGPLAEALAEVAGSGISPALAQQVERLFAGGPPGREALVAACVGYRDQLTERHPGLAGTLLDALNRAGVREIVADGQRFDPRLHEASGTEPTAHPELHDTVAETVRRGYADGGRVVRVPQVIVYRHGTEP